MDTLVIQGGRRLSGKVAVSGAKNSALPAIAACLLASGECAIEGVPDLVDVRTMLDVLIQLGVKAEIRPGSVRINAREIGTHEAPYELVRRMRASFLVMGPLLARLGKARISLPGGCAIGSRPIDLHLKGFEALGAEISMGYGSIEAVAPNGLTGAHVYLDFPSVGATENILMAATLARGTTVIENAAEEPEIVDLANLLNSMGAKIRGAGTNVLKIEGVDSLGPAVHTIIPDRIEAGTFMVAAAITGGRIRVENVLPEHLKPITAKLREAGAYVEEDDASVVVWADERLKAVDIKTMPHPGFPTDLQAQFMALMATARGTSMITETVFENRFMHVDELKRMGANIKIDGRSAVVEGVERLTGAPVKATDLRAGAALVLAGLAAEGETELMYVYHIDRGYEKLEDKLNALGASIVRRKVDTEAAIG